ncbi:MAG: 4-hydroxy-2-oxoheptanedioate aldolase [Pararhodobacter sp.]
MSAPLNRFKAALAARQRQFGLWLGLANPYTAEICAGAGFDWLVIDGEHAPNDLPRMLEQLQALAGHDVAPVVRVPIGETWLIKQVLDLGAQTVLVPMVESAAQARELVRAMRYPPEGVRGVGAALARASNFNRAPGYLGGANAQVCLLVQVESRAGLAAIEEIAALDGVDGIFIGPADLAADMGHLANPGAAEVKAAVLDGIARIARAGCAPGILTGDRAFVHECLDAGAVFVAVGSDVGLLSAASSALAAAFRQGASGARAEGSY